MPVDGLLRGFVGEVGVIDGVADVLAVAVELRHAAAHLQYHGLFLRLLLLGSVQVEDGFVLHAQLQGADGVLPDVRFGHEHIELGLRGERHQQRRQAGG